MPGNDWCADCPSPNPEWAVVNLGTLVCISCSGVHRGMGVHISKVRSGALDSWPPALLEAMLQLGNRRVNAVLARRDSAEDFSRLSALLFTATDWIFIPAYCFALP